VPRVGAVEGFCSSAKFRFWHTVILYLMMIILVVTDIAGLFPPRAPVDGGCGGELAVVVPSPVGLVVEDLLVDVVLVVVRLLDGVSIGVHLGLHHHRGGNHLTDDT